MLDVDTKLDLDPKLNPKPFGKLLAALALLSMLAGCSLPAVGSQAVSRVSPPLAPVGTYSLEGNPNFSPNQLSPELQVWHARLLEGIDEVNRGDSDNVLHPDSLAASGDLYKIGRHLNVYLTSLITALRVTGDLALLDEVDRLLEIARGELADYNADGYMNWRYLNEREVPGFYNDDYHVMDEVLAHSAVAAAAAALKANEAFDPRYREHAAFWTDYLQNEFEAKWRSRNDVSFGFPFMSRNLMHPYIQFIRYHHYMYQLTGDYAYEREAERRAATVQDQVREIYTPGGPGYVWDQRYFPDGDDPAVSCQPFVYLQYTFQGFQDLALEGLDAFDTAFMQQAATTMTDVVMDDGYRSFTEDICGGVFRQGLFPTHLDRGFEFQFLNYPFGSIGKWDVTGKIKYNVEEAFEHGDLNANTPAKANLSALMLLFLADDPDER